MVDRRIVTNEELLHCKPDLVVTEAKMITILEVAIEWDPNVQQSEREKHLKYQPLAVDLANEKYQPLAADLAG